MSFSIINFYLGAFLIFLELLLVLFSVSFSNILLFFFGSFVIFYSKIKLFFEQQILLKFVLCGYFGLFSFNLFSFLWSLISVAHVWLISWFGLVLKQFAYLKLIKIFIVLLKEVFIFEVLAFARNHVFVVFKVRFILFSFLLVRRPKVYQHNFLF